MIKPHGRRTYLACTIAIVSVGFSYSSLANELQQNNQLAPNDITLDTIVVTAAPQTSPLTVVTDPKQPRQPVPASDGADYLKTIPGFSVVRKGGSNGDPVFRGMFGSRLNILTDGGTILGGCGSRMDTPTSYISPETYDRITIIKGPQTVVWGPTGSAGTILFERDPHRFHELGGHVSGSILIGTDGRFDKNIDATGGNQYGYIRFTGNQSKAEDYHDGDNNRIHSKWNKWNGDLAVGITPDDDTFLELTAGRGNGEARYADRGMDGSRFLRESYGARFEKSNIGQVLDKVEAQIYYNYVDHVMDNFRLRHRNPPQNWMESNPDRRTLGGKVAATWQWSDFKLQAGIDGKRDTHRNKNTIRTMYPGIGMTNFKTNGWTKDAYITNYGAFGELTWYSSEQSRVITGARVDHYRARAEQISEERTETLPSGFMRFEYDLAQSPTTLYAGIGHTQRFPDYWELFSGANKNTAFKKLSPEKTTQIDFGLQYNNDRLSAWASGYVGWIGDYIIFNQQGTANNVANVDARIMGGEIGAAYKITDYLTTDASLAYSWGKNSSDSRALPQIPPLEVRLGLNYQYDKWSAGALMRIVDSQSRIATNQGNVIGKDFGKSSGFGIFSFNAGYQINKNLKLTAGVDNLFDRYYVEHLNRGGSNMFGFTADQQLPEPGRTLWTKLSFDF